MSEGSCWAAKMHSRKWRSRMPSGSRIAVRFRRAFHLEQQFEIGFEMPSRVGGQRLKPGSLLRQLSMPAAVI